MYNVSSYVMHLLLKLENALSYPRFTAAMFWRGRRQIFTGTKHGPNSARYFPTLRQRRFSKFLPQKGGTRCVCQSQSLNFGTTWDNVLICFTDVRVCHIFPRIIPDGLGVSSFRKCRDVTGNGEFEMPFFFSC